jgi:mRNA-degrading endonuclease RelE of RelBE toxin-antitoxin system
MRVETKLSFDKDLEKIPDDDALKVVKVLGELEQLPSLSTSKNLRKVEGQEHFFRARAGSYRIILRWDKKNQTLIAETVGHRKDIYKKK